MVLVLHRLEMVHAAVAVMVAHETVITSGCPAAHPGRLDQRDTFIRPQSTKPLRHRVATGPGADDREINGYLSVGDTRRRRWQGLVQAVCRVITRRFLAFLARENKLSTCPAYWPMLS